MKTYKNLWEKLISKENFEQAFKNAIRGKTKRYDVQKFLENKEVNLENLRQQVILGIWEPSSYKSKIIYEPKKREIFITKLQDRIVHHAIMLVLKPILEPKMILNTFSCINNRGPHKASRKCAEYTRKYKYCLKCDIRKFYPSINQKILSNMFHRLIKDFKFMLILDAVIFSFPGGKNCPIGNYTSQWFGNFYLLSLDLFVYHTLKCSAYLRYCDDFLLFSNSKNLLHIWREQIRVFIDRILKLSFSKDFVFNTKQGVDFCGYRHFKDYVKLRKTTALRLRRRIKKLFNAVENNSILDVVKANGQISSARGTLSFCCSYNFNCKVKFEFTEFVVWSLFKETTNKSFV